MPSYKYSAAKNSGELVQGVREAASPKALAIALKSDGLFLLNAENATGAGTSADFMVRLNDLISKIKPIGLVDKMFFTRNLGVMVAAGLSLTRSLEALSSETSNLKFKRIIEEVNESIIEGKSFADSLRPHQKIFGELFINMIEVGETSGKLTLVLKLLANQMRKDYTLRKRVRGAMLYPAIILVALFGIGTLMMVYIVPTLSQTIRELGVSLPLSTQIIMGISDLLVHYGLWVLIGLAVFIYILVRLLKTPRGKKSFDYWVLRAPIFGPLVKKFNMARFCRMLAYLIESGVPIVRSLEITSSVLGNTEFKEAAADASKEIQKGRQLHTILETYPKIFHKTATQMIGVGEETGKISSMLLRLALFYEEDVGATTKNLSTIIEPILMVVIGAAVGFFAVSMLQPIYSSIGNF